MFFRQNLKSESGVTLIELLVVVALIGILAGGLIMFVDPRGQINKANDARRKSDLNQIQKTLEVYYQDKGTYPAHTVGSYQISGVVWGGVWTDYMAKVPGDQTAGRTYVYYSTGQAYYLYAYLQAPRDPQMCSPGTGVACANATVKGIGNSCGGPCNYGVSSPNVTP